GKGDAPPWSDADAVRAAVANKLHPETTTSELLVWRNVALVRHGKIRTTEITRPASVPMQAHPVRRPQSDSINDFDRERRGDAGIGRQPIPAIDRVTGVIRCPHIALDTQRAGIDVDVDGRGLEVQRCLTPHRAAGTEWDAVAV